MAAYEVVFVEGAAAIALIVAGTALCVRSLAAAETVFGVRTSALALIIPVFGPAGCAVVETLQLHHGMRAVSIGFSLASAVTLLVLGAWSIWLGIRSIDARIFRYFLFSVPIPIVGMLALADSRISQFEATALILIYLVFVGSIWRLERPNVAMPALRPENLPPARKRIRAAVLGGCTIAAAGSALLLLGARTAMLQWHQLPLGSSFAALGMMAQIAAFVWVSMGRERSDLAVAGVIGSLAFNSTVMLAILGFTVRHRWIDPSPYTFTAIATLLVPSVLFPLAFKQAKRCGVPPNDSDIHLDNIFAWRNLKRDLSNFQLLHHRNVDGNLVTGMNSGTHWVTVMLATAIAKHHGLALPKYFSFTAAGDLVGIPSALVRRPGIPAIALSHNHPAALLAWPIVRKLAPIPKQVVLVRDIREVMVSAYVKWFPEREIPFSDFVRGDPTNRRGYLCDVWWYMSYLNRWGDVKASAPEETLVVRYEDMVGDPAHWLRRMSDHFGLDLSNQAIEAALTLRDKDAALARLDPNDTERVIAAPGSKADVRFSDADLRQLRSILSRHLRYDYGYDYGLKDTRLVPIDGLDPATQDNLPGEAILAMTPVRKARG